MLVLKVKGDEILGGKALHRRKIPVNGFEKTAGDFPGLQILFNTGVAAPGVICRVHGAAGVVAVAKMRTGFHGTSFPDPNVNFEVAHLRGLEPPTCGLGNRCSIQLSYRCEYSNSRIVENSVFVKVGENPCLEDKKEEKNHPGAPGF